MNLLRDADVLENLSENIRRTMQERGISQRALAEMTDQPVMTINYLVNGRHMPGFGVVYRVAQVLGLSLDELAEKPKPKKRSKTA